MTGVVFAIDPEPTLSAYDAETLATLLEVKGDARAMNLGHRIRRSVRTEKKVQLDRRELGTLARLFSSAPELVRAPEFAAFGALAAAVLAALYG